ncbi:unnamed protein product [Ectocarpus sp. 6 AP-2014]
MISSVQLVVSEYVAFDVYNPILSVDAVMPRHDEQRAILSSLPLEVLLYFNQWFSSCFFALTVSTYAYKGWRYYYPSWALELEVSLTILYGVVEMMRLFLASKGNKAEQINPLAMSLGLAVPVILLYAFSLALQTYVLRLDVIMAVIGLVFVGLEGLLSVGTAVSFYHAFRG